MKRCWASWEVQGTGVEVAGHRGRWRFLACEHDLLFPGLCKNPAFTPYSGWNCFTLVDRISLAFLLSSHFFVTLNSSAFLFSRLCVIVLCPAVYPVPHFALSVHTYSGLCHLPFLPPAVEQPLAA